MSYWPSHEWVLFARFTIFAFTDNAPAARAMLDDVGFSKAGTALWRVNLDALATIERNLMIKALHAERAELVEMRNNGVINDETMRVIEAEIDDAEASLGPANTRVRA